jgi:hypothetical protein
MKRIDQEQKGVPSFSSSSSSSSSTSVGRSEGVLEYWSVGVLAAAVDDENEAPIHFCGLRLELLARSVMSSETVLPKAVKTAGLMNPRLNWGYASDASPRRAATISLERRVVSKQ